MTSPSPYVTLEVVPIVAFISFNEHLIIPTFKRLMIIYILHKILLFVKTFNIKFMEVNLMKDLKKFLSVMCLSTAFTLSVPSMSACSRNNETVESSDEHNTAMIEEKLKSISSLKATYSGEMSASLLGISSTIDPNGTINMSDTQNGTITFNLDKSGLTLYSFQIDIDKDAVVISSSGNVLKELPIDENAPALSVQMMDFKFDSFDYVENCEIDNIKCSKYQGKKSIDLSKIPDAKVNGTIDMVYDFIISDDDLELKQVSMDLGENAKKLTDILNSFLEQNLDTTDLFSMAATNIEIKSCNFTLNVDHATY